MTVSNAYNHPDRLSEALRERILETAGRLGYQGPDPVGRSLRRQRTDVVGVLYSNPLSYTFDDPAAVSFMGGLSSVTEEADPPMSTVSQDHAEKGLIAGRMPYPQVPRKEMFSEVSSTLQCKTMQLGDASDRPKCHHCCPGRLVGQYHGLTMTTGARGE